MSSDLRQAVDDYVTLRRALGYQLRGYERYLDDLVADLQRAGAATLTIELAVAWATKPADAPPFRWKMRLGIARGFARYLQTLEPGHSGAADQPAGVPALATGPLPLQPGRDRRAAGGDRHADATAARGDLPHAAGAAGRDRDARRRGARA